LEKTSGDCPVGYEEPLAEMKPENIDSHDIKGLRLILRALRHRNYRLFFGGQSISLIGTWMQRIAMGWLVYRLTNSAFLLGLVSFLGLIPTFLLAPMAGVLADRWNRHRILVVTQSAAMIQALILAALVLTDKVTIWHIVPLSIFLGVINAADMPARQAFVLDMVIKKEDLSNAIALNSSVFNSARLLGPSVAGLLIAVTGEGVCFLINGISYLAVIVALLAMKITPKKAEIPEGPVWQRIKEGFDYAFGFAPIRAILLLLAQVSLIGLPYTVLMPVFARDILHGGPHILGFLMGATGVGALGGALYLASRRSVVGLERWIALAVGILGGGLLAFALSRVFWLSSLLMLSTGFGMMVAIASSNTILQTIVEDDKRGRVMSFYTMALMGMAPFGSLLAGGLASEIGASHTLMISGVLCLLGSLVFASQLSALRARIHPIYLRAGIIPEVASAIRVASEPGIKARL